MAALLPELKPYQCGFVLPYMSNTKSQEKKQLPILTESTLRGHDNPSDRMYTAIDGFVYDVTGKFVPRGRRIQQTILPPVTLTLEMVDADKTKLPGYCNFHPGGFNVLKDVLGKDGTEAFCQYHALDLLEARNHGMLRVGRLVPERKHGGIGAEEIALHRWVFDAAGTSHPNSPLPLSSSTNRLDESPR